jgi:hypothetical protein
MTGALRVLDVLRELGSSPGRERGRLEVVGWRGTDAVATLGVAVKML